MIKETVSKVRKVKFLSLPFSADAKTSGASYEYEGWEAIWRRAREKLYPSLVVLGFCRQAKSTARNERAMKKILIFMAAVSDTHGQAATSLLATASGRRP